MALAAVGVTAWLLVNRPYEGVTLVVLFDGNGLTAADLLCGPAVVLGIVISARSVRRGT